MYVELETSLLQNMKDANGLQGHWRSTSLLIYYSCVNFKPRPFLYSFTIGVSHNDIFQYLFTKRTHFFFEKKYIQLISLPRSFISFVFIDGCQDSLTIFAKTTHWRNSGNLVEALVIIYIQCKNEFALNLTSLITCKIQYTRIFELKIIF